MKRQLIVKPQNETLWFVSYSDLITAILAVLIMIMSFSKIDIEKVDHVNRLMKGDKLSTLFILKNEYLKLIKNKNLEKLVSIKLDDDGLSINTSSSVQFSIDSYKLDKNGIKLLEPIFNKIIEDSKYRNIYIVGHTDDSGTIKRNWELSSLRAYSVLEYLLKKNINYKYVTIKAHASNNPLKNILPTMSNLDKKIARSINRRVTIIIGRSHKEGNI